MSIKEKLLIVFLSIVVSFVGFNLIATSYARLLNEANEGCYEAIMSNLAKSEINSYQIPNQDDRALQFTRPNQDLFKSK